MPFVLMGVKQLLAKYVARVIGFTLVSKLSSTRSKDMHNMNRCIYCIMNFILIVDGDNYYNK